MDTFDNNLYLQITEKCTKIQNLHIKLQENTELCLAASAHAQGVMNNLPRRQDTPYTPGLVDRLDAVIEFFERGNRAIRNYTLATQAASDALETAMRSE